MMVDCMNIFDTIAEKNDFLSILRLDLKSPCKFGVAGKNGLMLLNNLELKS